MGYASDGRLDERLDAPVIKDQLRAPRLELLALDLDNTDEEKLAVSKKRATPAAKRVTRVQLQRRQKTKRIVAAQ